MPRAAKAPPSGFPEGLVRARTDNGLTQEELAKLVGVSVLTIKRYEAGASEPSLDTLHKLAIATQVTLDSLLGDTYVPPVSDEVRQRARVIESLKVDDYRLVLEVIDALLFRIRMRDAKGVRRNM